MTLFEEFKARGLIAQMTNEEKLQDLLDNGKATFYVGYDPTADSLHIGHFLQLSIMSRMQKAGHIPIVLIGGGTTMVGDPTGKSDMRKMLSQEDIQSNAECFKVQMKNLIEFGENKAMMLDNAEWLLKLNYVDFLRDIGVHFSVNRMLTAECFKSRMERGLSFIEFNYMLMQSYDFLVLNEKYGCTLQMGGDDQWSNIINGADLIRRKTGREAYGMTFTLLTTSDGKKMGKTEKGAVWLDPNKTSPFEFYQYWRNVDDADVVRCMKLLTFIPVEQIITYENLQGSELNPIKDLLAFEMTKMVHGEQNAAEAQQASQALFGAGADLSNMPSTQLCSGDFENNSITILDLMVKAGLTSSKGEARRLVEQGGISVNDEKVSDCAKAFTTEEIQNGNFIIKKGKKTFHKITL